MDKIGHVMLFSVAVGVLFITISFFLNIISLVKQRNYTMLLTGSGGVLWLLIYWFMIGIAVKAVVFGLSVKVEAVLLLILFLTALGFFIYRTRQLASSVLDALMNIVEHATNTVSFIRLGAFALAHAALFLAVFTIADIVGKSDEKGLLYWLVVILGNCIIIVLEGVVVTIQTLRLEYYEFFKRFFKGGGTPYKPFCLKGTSKNPGYHQRANKV